MPPTRGHDLKRTDYGTASLRLLDAPHTGARLETCAVAVFCRGRLDAPHTGARLETVIAIVHRQSQMMPPTRGHDLKPGLGAPHGGQAADAPHTGARLET